MVLATDGPLVLSFDVEEHHRIEAGATLTIPAEQRQTYSERMEATTRDLLDLLAEHKVPATFYVVGEIARNHPQLIRAISEAGHELASHSWDHQRVHRHTPDSFREDLRKSRDALEQASGTPVVGYRAPTFSVVRQTAWAVDVLAEEGWKYDSSVFPVRHDRYGEPGAPRSPFWLKGTRSQILEIPPLTWRVLGQNLPVAGGGYFRLFPPAFMRAGVRQLRQLPETLGMFYFHPWEFDPGQPRLPLKRLSSWRTYVGIEGSRDRLARLIKRYPGRFTRAVDQVDRLRALAGALPTFTFPTQAV